MSDTQRTARARDLADDLYVALKQCAGVLVESGDLNNYRIMTDEELGRMWIACARNAAMLLNMIDGLPTDYAPLAKRGETG